MTTRDTITRTIAELDGGDTALAFDVMRELRPHLTDAGEFAELVRAQRREGYRLVVAYDETDRLVSLAGFRHMTNLYAGPHLYIDDLSTLPSARGRGHAGALLRWVDEEARRLGCAGVHLDSGTPRHDAHRLYLASGFVIPAFHFAKSL
ncbi:GNAT family N-acetyltransferase [Lentzea flaviverrucosa]|uniref:Acetyltransferase (GNAT) family protein n=1 Tax=Lentzea flaviverrucosa TaxID=200379 RepID=A0A1H9D6X5_9PSEU|nr:GNAT family N-acetyltransferase [Lentzea flaviverrucosa]RDI24765.1 acetyltransferase (GNAT) family protein [Lentzea flaviverrucosa]SEQ09210.1 Acetyltransferase (GNAT) family protein [Lentzea flaviverrucosa]